MRKICFVLAAAILFSATAFAQVAISSNGAAPDANTMLDIKSNNKGVKFPMLSSAERTAMNLSGSDAGMMVFDRDKQALYMYDGQKWLPFAYANPKPGSISSPVYPEHGVQRGYNYGETVAINGEFAAVAAPEDTVGANKPGSVFIYRKTNATWAFHSRIVPPFITTASIFFGRSISIQGNYMVIGATDVDGAFGQQGAAFIYFFNGTSWQYQQKIQAADPQLNGNFGVAVKIDNNTIVAGAHRTDVAGKVEQGAAYVFIRNGNTWTQQAKLIAPDGAASAFFGSCIALDGDYVAIGAYNTKVNDAYKGAVYVYVRGGGTWTFQQKLMSDITIGDGYFGGALSMQGNILVVGATTEIHANANCGGIHLFKREGATWTRFTTRYSPATQGYMYYGAEVSFRNNYLLVSAPGEKVNGIESGAVYLYKLHPDGLIFIKKIDIPYTTDQDSWAYSLDFDGTNFLISSPRYFPESRPGV